MKAPIDQMIDHWKKEIDFYLNNFEQYDDMSDKLEAKDRMISYNVERFNEAMRNYLDCVKLRGLL